MTLGRRGGAVGASQGDLLDGYPRLSREDVRAATAFAAEMIAHEVSD